MKRLNIIICTFLLCSYAAAQNPVIRGEVTPGVYANIAVDSSGNIITSSTGNSSTAGAKAGGTAAAMSDLVGGIYSSSPATLTNGQQTAIQLGTTGNVKTQLMGADGNTAITAISGGSDGVATGSNTLVMSSFNRVYNGTSWDRQAGNTTGTFVVARATPGTMTDRSGTFTAANTSQQIMAANANRRYLMIQNSGDAVMWCNFTTAATLSQPSFTLAIGASFVMENSAVSTEAINCISGTISKPYTAKEM